MNYFQSNISMLKNTNPLFLTLNYPKLHNKDFVSDDINLIENFENKITLEFVKNNKSILMHSKYNIERENELILSDIEDNKDQLIIVFGLGLTYHLEALKKKITPDSRVFIIEYNADVLSFALTHIDMTGIFDDSRFMLISGSENTIEQMIIGYFGINFYNLAYNIKVINLPNYYQLYSEKILGSLKSINRRILSQLYSYGNSLEDMFNGFKNNYMNIDACIECNGFSEIENIYKDIPAVIVASGPSLDKNIDQLIEAQGKTVIISCDASLNACKIKGIEPDCVSSIERDFEIYDYYYRETSIDSDIVLVGPSLLWPDIFEGYKGKKILSTKMEDGVENWWGNQFEAIEFVDTGQSSATYAYAAAVRMGCNPIILIGQDLGYSEGKIHSDLTHHNEQGANDDHRHDGVYLKDYDGNLLRSNIGYRLFKEWYELKILADSERTVINATEGGAYIQGTIRMSLDEAINKYCNKEKDGKVFDKLKKLEISNTDYIRKYDAIIHEIDLEIEKVKKLSLSAENHKETLDRLDAKVNMMNINEKNFNYAIEKLQKGDAVIQYILNDEETRTIRAYYKQVVVQTIAQVKRIGNELTGGNLAENFRLQYYLMSLLIESSKLIIERYSEMEEYIKLKRKQRTGSETLE